MIRLAESDTRLIEALDRCLAERHEQGVATRYLWVHVIADQGEVHFYPSERDDIQHPEDELLGQTVLHMADIDEWTQSGGQFQLEDGTTATAKDARERQQIISAHVAKAVCRRAASYDPILMPSKIVIHSESGEFETSWEAAGLL